MARFGARVAVDRWSAARSEARGAGERARLGKIFATQPHSGLIFSRPFLLFFFPNLSWFPTLGCLGLRGGPEG